MKERMETGERREPLEILPENIGTLPSTEAAPLLERAASRIEITRPKSEFREGLNENLRGAAAWIEAQKAKFKGRTLNIIAGVSLVTTVLTACAQPPESQMFIPPETAVATQELPTEIPTKVSAPRETPTAIPTPEPTRAPETRSYTGPITEVDGFLSRGSGPILKDEEMREDWGIDEYSIILTYPLTLMSVTTQADSQIVELVWGFRLKNQDYQFRVLSAPFYSDLGLMSEPGMGNLPLGDADYEPSFEGIESPIAGTVYEEKILNFPYYREENAGFREIVHNLRNDPEDKVRMLNFLRTGDINGFEIDEDGIVDLRNVIWNSQSGPNWSDNYIIP